MGSHADPPAGADRLSRAGCGVPAGVVDQFVLASTSGPVEHVRTWCLNGHGYTQRLDAVTGWPMERAKRPLSAGG